MKKIIISGVILISALACAMFVVVNQPVKIANATDAACEQRAYHQYEENLQWCDSQGGSFEYCSIWAWDILVIDVWLCDQNMN